ncbi:FtsW/RodA/SpoVE family cell cycle protein [Viscerimonas tarda]
MDFFSKTFRGDKTIWCIFAALCFISLLEIFSATSTIVYKQQDQWGPILRHATFLLIGFGGVMFLQRIPTRYFSGLILILPLSWILLGLTFVMGENVNGAQRWLGVGAFSFQPSEIAKIAAIGFVAFFLSKVNAENEKKMFKIMIIGVVITCMIIFSENLSTAILLFMVCFLMMFIGQISWRRLGAIVLVGSLAGLLLVGTLKIMPADVIKNYFPDRFETWKNRIDRHTDASELNAAGGNVEEYNIEDNFQVTHAKIAIANGGIIGLPGSGAERDFLPQAYSDFIFAIILEEMGLAGGLFVLLLYLALMFRVGILANKCKKLFPKYLLLGAGLILTIQALINMAVAVNLMPVTGQPLPLISRGGSSTVMTCIYFGIILACSNFKEEEHEDADEGIANVQYE